MNKKPKARARTRVALGVGCLAATLLLIPAAASAARAIKHSYTPWTQFVEATDVTETSATIEVYIHPLWSETHWDLRVWSGPCYGYMEREPEPERCDENFRKTHRVEGTIFRKSPYEIVEETVSIPGPLIEPSLLAATVFTMTVETTGLGPTLAQEEYPSNFESFETPGPRGSEEQGHRALIAKERSIRQREVRNAKRERKALERKLARESKA